MSNFNGLALALSKMHTHQCCCPSHFIVNGIDPETLEPVLSYRATIRFNERQQSFHVLISRPDEQYDTSFSILSSGTLAGFTDRALKTHLAAECILTSDSQERFQLGAVSGNVVRNLAENEAIRIIDELQHCRIVPTHTSN